MTEELRQQIAETIDGGAWETITARLWQDGQPWELWKLEQDVEHEGRRWRCVIVQRVTFDPEDPDAVDTAEDVFAEAWPL